MPRAILSVYDKRGLVPFAQGLIDLEWNLIASGGTARMLRENGIPVTDVSTYTGSPEILSGRVKTLHPAIHAGLLARNTDADFEQLIRLGWEPIDLAAVNLYPFEATIARPGVTRLEAIENIDIGGLTLIRAAAKNSSRVTMICDPDNYEEVLEQLQNDGETTQELRRKLAVKGFQLTARYDAAISTYLAGLERVETRSLTLYPVQTLRYGENPHQKAMLYGFNAAASPLGGQVLQGKELSYNNLLDLDAAWRVAVAFNKPAVAIVKHLSPCGIACGKTLEEAYHQALACDPVSAYGGVIACSQEIDETSAAAMLESFVECIAAPGFTQGALDHLAKKKNCRLVSMPDLCLDPPVEYRTVNRGLLCQEIDFGDPEGTEWKVVSARAPGEDEMQALKFAWKACQYVKSNAIVFARGEATVGIGGGQPNRVDCVKIAAQRAGDKARGAVMASDAFFPFADSIEVAAEAGITAVIQPGGSIRDADSIAAADKYQIAMVTTGVRHFRH